MDDKTHTSILDHVQSIKAGNRAAIGAYLNALPSWPQPNKPGNFVGDTTPAEDQVENGHAMSCSTTAYTLATNPEQIVMFEPDLGSLWPGSLLQGKGFAAEIGSLRELPIKKRSPLNVSVS